MLSIAARSKLIKARTQPPVRRQLVLQPRQIQKQQNVRQPQRQNVVQTALLQRRVQQNQLQNRIRQAILQRVQRKSATPLLTNQTSKSIVNKTQLKQQDSKAIQQRLGNRQAQAKQENINRARQIALQNQNKQTNAAKQQQQQKNNDKVQRNLKQFNEKNELSKKQFNQATNENRKRKADLLSERIQRAVTARVENLKKDMPPIKKIKINHHSNVPHPEHQKSFQNTASDKAREAQEKIHKADALFRKMNQKINPLINFESQKKQYTNKWDTAPAPTHFTIKKKSDSTNEILKVHPKVYYVDKPKKQTPPHLSKEEKGKMAEAYSSRKFISDGYEHLPTKIGSNNGIDGFFIRRNANGRINSVAIVESKFASNAKVKLDIPEGKGVQMTYGWLKETLKLMEKDPNPEVREAAKVMKQQGNKVLDNRYVNVMTPDGKVKWFQFIKKKYDTRNFEKELDDFSDGEIYQIDENSIAPQTW